jgi:hypothetical protein
MEPGEGQFHLRLHAAYACHLAAGRMGDEVVQQSGLAHTRLTTEYQHPALPGPNRADDFGKHADLARPPPQGCSASVQRRTPGHRDQALAFR